MAHVDIGVGHPGPAFAVRSNVSASHQSGRRQQTHAPYSDTQTVQYMALVYNRPCGPPSSHILMASTAPFRQATCKKEAVFKAYWEWCPAPPPCSLYKHIDMQHCGTHTCKHTQKAPHLLRRLDLARTLFVCGQTDWRQRLTEPTHLGTYTWQKDSKNVALQLLWSCVSIFVQ